MAIFHQQLDTAEMALAAIDEVDKLQFIQAVKAIPSIEGRNAELFLFRRMPDDAERILLQANLIYRAINLNIKIFRWEKALDLAVKHKTHVDTVLAYRKKYLNSLKREEKLTKFLEKNKEFPDVDWPTITGKEKQELEKEATRNTPYVSSFAAKAVEEAPEFDVSPISESKYSSYTPAPLPPERKEPDSSNFETPAPAPAAAPARRGRGRGAVAAEETEAVAPEPVPLHLSQW